MINIFCYQFHINDWDKDTKELSFAEIGAYLKLVNEYYRQGGKLVANHKKLCRILGAQTPTERKTIKYIITNPKYFSEKDSYLVQSRCDIEIKSIIERREKNRQNAKSKYKENNDIVSATAERSDSETEANALPTNNQQPITNNKSKDKDTPIPPKSEKHDLNEAVMLYNELAKETGLPTCQKLSETRRKHLTARLNDCGGMDGWREALTRVRASEGLLGGNSRGWKADFDFLVRESSFIKIMEGKYNGWSNTKTGSEQTKQQLQDWVDGR